MSDGASLCEHVSVAHRTINVPSARRSSDRVLTGSAGGWADQWGVDPTVVRAVLALLTFVGGFGALLYGAMFALSDPPESSTASSAEALDHRRDLAVAAGTLAMLIAACEVGVWPGDQIMVPAAAAAVGVAIAWSGGRGDHAAGRPHPALRRTVRFGAGIVLLIAGVVSLANLTGGLGSVGASLSAIAVVVGGLSMFAASCSTRSPVMCPCRPIPNSISSPNANRRCFASSLAATPIEKSVAVCISR
jgi:phage shock protein PspC (stress-responsive transcriptional regulator)